MSQVFFPTRRIFFSYTSHEYTFNIYSFTYILIFGGILDVLCATPNRIFFIYLEKTLVENDDVDDDDMGW